MRQTPDTVVTQDVDRGVEDLRPSFRIGRHQFSYCRRQNMVRNAGYTRTSRK
jgi:hypothetical protein